MRTCGIVFALFLVACGAPEQGEDARVRFGPVTAADDALPLYVVRGSQWVWSVELPTGGVVTNELVLPVGQPVRIEVRSEDVEHRWLVDGTPLRIDVPAHGSVTRRVEALAPAELHTVCQVSCGEVGDAFVMSVRFASPEESRRWLDGRDLPTGTTLAQHGATVYASSGCSACHAMIGGDLHGIGGTTRAFEDGTSLALDATRLDGYLRESITSPDAHRVVGSESIHMPAFDMRAGDLDAVVAYTSCIATGCASRPECAGACD